MSATIIVRKKTIDFNAFILEKVKCMITTKKFAYYTAIVDCGRIL